MKKSLASILLIVAVCMAIALKILTRSFVGPLILLGMAGLYYGVSFASEAWKAFGPKKEGPAAGGEKRKDG